MSLTQWIDAAWSFGTLIFDKTINIPSGISTIIAGSFVIIAARIAWRGVQEQIKAQKDVENIRERREQTIIITGLTAELICYSASLIDATSRWNDRAHKNPAAPVDQWPIFPRPQVYTAVLGRIGLLDEGWPACAVIGFYCNLLELNDMATEQGSAPHSEGENTEKISRRLQKMAANLSQALDGLNQGIHFPIPEEVALDKIVAPDGKIISSMSKPPNSIQTLLAAISGSI